MPPVRPVPPVRISLCDISWSAEYGPTGGPVWIGALPIAARGKCRCWSNGAGARNGAVVWSGARRKSVAN